jgi:hypothetical protein
MSNLRLTQKESGRMYSGGLSALPMTGGLPVDMLLIAFMLVTAGIAVWRIVTT